MKHVDPLESDQNEPLCPKRLWVLTTLSDDELLDDGEALPQGLQFHLSRCESCQALADRLLAVTTTLREVSKLEPGSNLADRADAQAATALRCGGKLTGRASIPDEPQVEIVRSHPAVWRRMGWVAAAAVIVLAATIVGISRLSEPHRQVVVDRDESGTLTPGPPVPELQPDGTNETLIDAPTERLADSHGRPEPSRHLPYRIPRYHSHDEAAMADDPGGFQAAIVLPDPAARDISWTALFDTPASVESTDPSSNER